MRTILAAAAVLSLSIGAAFAAGAPVGSFKGQVENQYSAPNGQSAGAAASTRGG